MNRKKLVNSLIILAVTVVFTVLVMMLDKAPVGPYSTEIGFSTVNDYVSGLFPFNSFFYTLTKIIGYVSLLGGGAFAVVGIYQLFTRKSLRKVDRLIYCLGGLYLVLGAVYFAFEKIVINYRPILLEGETYPAPSYPSSHTMLATVILWSIILVIDSYVKNIKYANAIKLVCFVLMTVNVVCRLASGVHWLTDIIGGILVSATLISFFDVIAFKSDTPEEKTE